MILFEKLGLNQEILRGIEEIGFEAPTPIQEKVISFLLEQQGDLVALAQTGTGKTAAFGLPICQLAEPSESRTQALILAPTRELCIQIAKELKLYSKFVNGLRIEPVYGGESIEKQIRNLEKKPHILVATPGRLTDLLHRKKVQLENLTWVVLDEADEMLDMGFEEDLTFILGKTPDNRTTLLFSATMSKEVMQVARNYMKDPVEISAGKKNSGTENVSHHYYVMEPRNRYHVLKRLADLYPEIFGIVFCRTRRETQEVADSLTRDGYNADALHGDLSQAQRDSVMKKFRDKNLNILVATDVAARGLDVNNLTHVINYNLPDDIETYTHRSGRTGRANNTGTSIALVTPSERRKIARIEKILQRRFEQKQIPGPEEVLQKQLFNFINKVESADINEEQLLPLMDSIYKKLDWMDKKQLINHFVSYEITRFLKYYENARDLNVKVLDRQEKRDSGRTHSRSKKTVLKLNIGSRDGMVPAKLLGLLNETVGGRTLQVGRIDIQKNHSVFEVNERDAEKVVDKFRKRFQGQKMIMEMGGVATKQRRRNYGLK